MLAFHNCNKIKNAYKSSHTEIFSYSFNKLKYLEEIVLSDDTSKIQDNAFVNCPKAVKILGVNVFTTEKNRIFSLSDHK